MDEPTQTPTTLALSSKHWLPDLELFKSLATTKGAIDDIADQTKQTVNTFFKKVNEAFKGADTDLSGRKLPKLTTDQYSKYHADLGKEYAKTLYTMLTRHYDLHGPVKFSIDNPAVFGRQFQHDSVITGTLVLKAQEQNYIDVTSVYVGVPEWDVPPAAPPSTEHETPGSQDVGADTSH